MNGSCKMAAGAASTSDGNSLLAVVADVGPTGFAFRLKPAPTITAALFDDSRSAILSRGGFTWSGGSIGIARLFQ